MNNGHGRREGLVVGSHTDYAVSIYIYVLLYQFVTYVSDRVDKLLRFNLSQEMYTMLGMFNLLDFASPIVDRPLSLIGTLLSLV